MTESEIILAIGINLWQSGWEEMTGNHDAARLLAACALRLIADNYAAYSRFLELRNANARK